MRFKRTVSVILAAAAVLSLCACGRLAAVDSARELAALKTYENLMGITPEARRNAERFLSQLAAEETTTAPAVTRKPQAKKTTAVPVTTKAATAPAKTTTTTTTVPATKPEKPVEQTLKSVPFGGDDYFGDCAFVGNSRMLHFKEYGLAGNVFAVIGLTVDTVFTEHCSGSSVPVIDELCGGGYKKVYLMFGDNECGWPYLNVFCDHYKKVIDAVKQRCPGAEIYIQSVLPISREASNRNEFGANNGRIEEMNVYLKELAAKEGISYVSPADALKTDDGCLPAEAAFDGVHLEKKYCIIWIEYLRQNS